MFNTIKKYHIEILIFITLFMAGSYFYYTIDYDNTSSRLYMVSSIVDFGVPYIDPYASMTTDKSFNGEHYYSNKAIGATLLAVPFYWLQRQIPPWRTQAPLTPFMRYVIRIFTSTLPFALLGLVLYRMSVGWGIHSKKSLLMVFAYGFGSIALIHASMFSGHGTAAAFSFFGFAALVSLKKMHSRPVEQDSKESLYLNIKKNMVQAGPVAFSEKHKLMLATLSGLSIGFAALCDFITMYIALVLSIYALTVAMPFRLKLAFLTSGLFCTILLAVYNLQCFGSPFSLSYANLVTKEFVEQGAQGFLGISLPKLKPLIALLFSPARGLFAIMPVFLFSVLGIVKMIRSPSLRSESIVILAVVAGYLLIIAGWYGWHGGWTYGPRYIVPMLPFLAVSMVFAPTEPFAFALSLALSITQTNLVAISFPHTPELIRNPLIEIILPCIRNGYMAESWPQWLGLSTKSSIILYIILSGLLVSLTWHAAAKKEAKPDNLLKVRKVSEAEKTFKKNSIETTVRPTEYLLKTIGIRDWRFSLPMGLWLATIAFMLNVSYTKPRNLVPYYQKRLLFHLHSKEVIYNHLRDLTEAYEGKE